MRICGIELKGSEAVIVILEGDKTSWSIVDCPAKKLKLEDDENATHIRSFATAFESIVKEHGIDTIAIKKRGKKGNFMGGPVSFKIEGIIQLISPCEVSLVSPVSISNYAKKNPASEPTGLYNYQLTAFDVARTFMGRS